MVNSLRGGVVLTRGKDFFLEIPGTTAPPRWNSGVNGVVKINHQISICIDILTATTRHRTSLKLHIQALTSHQWPQNSHRECRTAATPRSWDPWPPTRKSPPSEVANSFGSRRKPKGKLIWAQRKKVLSFYCWSFCRWCDPQITERTNSQWSF